MRNVIFLLVAVAAAAMAYLYVRPTCPGGAIVLDQTGCARSPGFDAAFCREAFARAPGIQRVSGPSYLQRADCDNAWPVCLEHAGGWGPRPSGWCIARDSAGVASRMEPVYENRRGPG